MFTFEQTKIDGLIVVKPKIYTDNRGEFWDSYKKNEFFENGITSEFIQDNISESHKNTIRGLHFQADKFAQAKLVKVMKGSIKDVVLDLRDGSKTFGEHLVFEMKADGSMLYVPRGFAHGFISLEDNTIFHYQVDNSYEPTAERCINAFDPNLNIDWGIKKREAELSPKDNLGMYFSDFKRDKEMLEVH